MSQRLCNRFVTTAILLAGLACSALASNPPLPHAAPKTAALPAKGAADDITFALIGDFGQAGPGEQRVAQLVHRWQPDFIVTAGDDNYPDGAAATIDANIGQYYHDFILFDPNYRGPWQRQGATEQRFFPALGNHDWDTAHAQPYVDYFDLPGNERYYQVKKGAVEFFIVDSDRREPDGVKATTTQGLWLQASLQASSAAWKIVVMHHPPYSSGEHGNNRWMQWPYRAWGASMVVAGHDHHYERAQRQGLTHIIVGTGGAQLREANSAHRVDPEVDITYAKTYGAILGTANAHKAVFKFYNIENELIDSFELAKR